MRETTNEWLVAEEICDGLEFLSAEGRVEFDTDVELDGMLVEVVGAVTYESEYDAASNYRCLTYVSVEIEHVSVPARVRLNERLIAKYITKILMR